MGEMTSALPFSGGIFGYVRAATGPYYGFVVACFEIVYCLSYMVVIVYIFTLIPVVAGTVDASYTPNLIFLTYGFVLFMNLLGGKPFWALIALVGFTTFVLLLIFLFGVLADVNRSNMSFTDYCQTNIPVTFESMMKERWLVDSQFQGLQYLPLLSEYVKEPRKTIPRALAVCGTEFVWFSLFVALGACSMYPGQGILQLVLTPLMFGFQQIFTTDPTTAMWLHAPGLFAPCLAMLFCSGKQLSTISKSGMLPSFLQIKTPGTETPVVALVFAACTGTLVNLYIYYYPELDIFNQLINVISVSVHFVFINAFVAYLLFRKKYSSMPRSFTNPFGVWGAYFGLANNVLGLVAVIIYAGAGDASWTLIIMACYFVAASIFYWGYMVKRQTFSEEEKKLLFKAYLINGKEKSIFFYYFRLNL